MHIRTGVLTAFVALCSAALITGPVSAGDIDIGGKAPTFTLNDSAGNPVALADSAGKLRVLEWVNPGCPFVKRHYQAGTMKKLAEKYADQGVVWLAVNSTHSMDAKESDEFRKQYELPYPLLVDRDGTVGRAYGAATTPQLFIIDGDGTVVYQGAIDDDPRGSTEAPLNYVDKALGELLAGKPVSTPETKSYGCSVKYAR